MYELNTVRQKKMLNTQSTPQSFGPKKKSYGN